MNKVWADSLTNLKIDLWPYVESKDEEILAWDNEYGQYYLDIEQLQVYLDDEIDAYRLSEFWYERFRGGCFWSGILSAYPWENVMYDETGKYNYGDEESIWQDILDYHFRVFRDKENYQFYIKFIWNKESPLNGWLRHHSTDGDVPINVQTIFEQAIKFVMKNRHDDIVKFEYSTNLYCPECDRIFQMYENETDCPDCESELQEPETCKHCGVIL